MSAAMSPSSPPYPLYPVTVKRCALLSPHMKRITIDSFGLPPQRPHLPAQWFKLFVPIAGGGRSGGRAYTVRRHDPATHELDIDMYLHGDSGPVSAWAARAQPGDGLEVSDVHPRSGFPIDDATRHYLLFGDETGLPAIGAILEALPRHACAEVFILVANAAETLAMSSPATLSIHWIYRDGLAIAEPAAFVVAARKIGAVPPGTAILAAAESAQVSGLRKLFAQAPGFDPGRVHAAGYWKRGASDHMDTEA